MGMSSIQRAVLLLKITEPVREHLPMKVQDAIFRTVGRAHRDYIAESLPKSASMVFHHVTRLINSDLAELREALDAEDWNRRILRDTGDGQSDVNIWLSENPHPRETNDYTVLGDPDTNNPRIVTNEEST